LIDVLSATNRQNFMVYLTTPQTTAQTTDVDYAVSGATGVITNYVSASQPSGTFIFTAQDGQSASVSITQLVAAAGTLYITNLPLGTMTAQSMTVRAIISTTNAANNFQAGHRPK
jgi:hypothetical protein